MQTRLSDDSPPSARRNNSCGRTADFSRFTADARTCQECCMHYTGDGRPQTGDGTGVDREGWWNEGQEDAEGAKTVRPSRANVKSLFRPFYFRLRCFFFPSLSVFPRGEPGARAVRSVARRVDGMTEYCTGGAARARVSTRKIAPSRQKHRNGKAVECVRTRTRTGACKHSLRVCPCERGVARRRVRPTGHRVFLGPVYGRTRLCGQPASQPPANESTPRYSSRTDSEK